MTLRGPNGEERSCSAFSGAASPALTFGNSARPSRRLGVLRAAAAGRALEFLRGRNAVAAGDEIADAERHAVRAVSGEVLAVAVGDRRAGIDDDALEHAADDAQILR